MDDLGKIHVEGQFATLADARRPELHEVPVHFSTGYQELADFAQQLRRAVELDGGEAVLVGA